MKRTLILSALLASFPAYNWADENGQKPQNQQQSQAKQNNASDQAHQNMDDVIAHCMALSNQEEIAISKFAQSRAKHDKVKEFASMMVSDHETALKQLPQEHQNHAASLSATSIQENKKGESHSSGDSQTSLMSIQTEIAQQCLRDTQAKLEQEGRDKFDQCYIGTQIAMHAGMHSKLTVFERHASAEMKPKIAKALATTKQHLEKAEAIMEELDKTADRSN
jgi:predicted outer membrane protein